MRVKVGNTWYDGTKEPICVEFSPRDKATITKMKAEGTRYSILNKDLYTVEQMRDWLDDLIEL